MSQQSISIFQEPREETALRRFWERWGNLLIVLLIVVGVLGGNIWHLGRKDENRAALAFMHRKLAEEIHAHPAFAGPGTYLAGYPHGLYYSPKDGSNLWTFKVPAEWTDGATGERREGFAVGTISVFEDIGGFLVDRVEAVAPTGEDLALARQKLAESRSANPFYVVERAKYDR